MAPGRATDELRALDAAYAFALREWTFSFRTKSERSDGFIGAADNLGRQNQLNTNQLGVEVKWSRALENVGVLSLRGGFLRSETSDLLEIYPSGYQLEGDFGTLIFGKPGGQGGVFQQVAFNSRRFDVPGHPRAGPEGRPQAHGRTRACATTRPSTCRPTPTSTCAPSPRCSRGAGRVARALSRSGAGHEPHDLRPVRRRRLDGVLPPHGDGRPAPRPPERPRGHPEPAPRPGGRLPEGLARKMPSSREGFGWKLLYGRAFRAPTLRELAFDLPSGTGQPRPAHGQGRRAGAGLVLHPQSAPPRGAPLPEPAERRDRPARAQRAGQHRDLRERSGGARRRRRARGQRQLRRRQLVLRELHVPEPDGSGTRAGAFPACPRTSSTPASASTCAGA